MTNTTYLVGFKGHRKLIAICGKFVPVSGRIWQTDLRNSEKIATETVVLKHYSTAVYKLTAECAAYQYAKLE